MVAYRFFFCVFQRGYIKQHTHQYNLFNISGNTEII